MAAPPPDPYRTLGVTHTATDEEIRTAYRRLAQLHHPDHNNGSRESALRFAEVQEAYAHVKLMRRQASATAGRNATAGQSATAGRNATAGQSATAGRNATAGQGATAGRNATAGHSATAGAAPGRGAPSGSDPALEERLAAMEQELRAARAQRERAARAAAEEAARAAKEADRQRRHARGGPPPKPEAERASDEELGYYSTDDSFTKILDDFADQVASRFADAHPPQRDADAAKRPRGRGPSRSLADWIDELGSRLSGEPTRGSRDEGSRDEGSRDEK